MGGQAIAAQAIGARGAALLTTDFGRTRLAEIARARPESRAGAAERDEAARAARP